MSNLGPPINAPGAGASSGGTYEFSPADNIVFSETASNMKFVAIFSIILGLCQMAYGVLSGLTLEGLALVGQGLVLAVVGGWLVSAAQSFNAVANTSGGDIMHLMGAMHQLRKVYRLQARLIILAIVFTILAIVLVTGRTSSH